MWEHRELVFEHSPHKGAAHTVLIYLAIRADRRTHSCYPGNDKIAADLRLDKRTVIRAIKTLSKKGDILRVSTGSGRGHASIWMLAETYRPKGDIVTPIKEGKGDITPPFSNENSDISPPFQIKGDIVSIKGDIVSQRVTSDPLKGGVVSPQGKKKERRRKEKKEREHAPAREAPAPSPDVPAGASSYAAIFKTLTGVWVGFGQQDYLVKRLGNAPNWEVLGQVYEEWSTSGNNTRNLRGIFDWYDNRLGDPDWQPYPSNGNGQRKPARSNGSGPKTFDQMKQDNTVAAAHRLMEKYANEQS